MKHIELEVSKREITGKKVNVMRRQGITPANLFGQGIDSMALQVDNKQLKQTLARAGKTDLISLQISGSKTPTMVIIREVQKNPLTDELLHVNFYKVKMTEKLKADIPIAFVGEAPALKKIATSLLHLIDSLSVEALPDILPHKLEIDLSMLEETNQAIFVKDITVAEGITILSNPEQMIVKVTETRREAEAAKEEMLEESSTETEAASEN